VKLRSDKELANVEKMEQENLERDLIDPICGMRIESVAFKKYDGGQ
jgi:hypothetical protein